MELSVSFTGEESAAAKQAESERAAAERGKLYISEESCLGSVFIPREGVRITGPIRVRYEKYPWIEKFEVDGLKPAPPKRKGVGTKDIKGFVRSLSTIYSGAYDDYDKYFGAGAADSQDKADCNAREKAREYFAAVTAHFIRTLHESMGTVLFDSPGAVKLFRKFCGFTENMWREGNGEMLGICLGTVVPMLRSDAASRVIFAETITDEFKEYLQNGDDEKGQAGEETVNG